MRISVAIKVNQIKRSADFGFSDALGSLCDPLPVEPGLLGSEVHDQAYPGGDEDEAGFP